MENKKQNKKKEKPIKKAEKYIWFIISVVIALVGGIFHSQPVLPAWVKIVYAALLLFTAIMAAQKTSIERYAYSAEGTKTDRTKYVLVTILYYLFIIIAVFYVFLALWVAGILSI